MRLFPGSAAHGARATQHFRPPAVLPAPHHLAAIVAATLIVGAGEPSIAAQLGAEDPYQVQPFDDRACARRTLLGACAEQKSTPEPEIAPQPPSVRSAPQLAPEAESELVRTLRARSEQNAEANARTIREKTLANGLSGSFGPLAKTAPVMRTDGSFEIIKLAKLEKLKDMGIVRTAPSGLNVFANGYETSPTDEELAEKLGAEPGFLGLPPLPKIF